MHACVNHWPWSEACLSFVANIVRAREQSSIFDAAAEVAEEVRHGELAVDDLELDQGDRTAARVPRLRDEEVIAAMEHRNRSWRA